MGGFKMSIKFRLKELLNDRNMTQKELVEKTGLRPNSISEMVNNQRSTINKEHAAAVANALGIEDLNELFELDNGTKL